MFQRLVVWWLCIQQVSSLEGFKKAFQSGDIILGGLNVLHYKDPQDRCGGFYPVGLSYSEAMIFVIEQINNDVSVLPNTTLGFDIRDYCETVSIAVKETYEFVRDRDLYHLCASNNSGVVNETTSCCYLSKDSTPVTLIIGPHDSASAVQIGSLLSVAEIPIISFSATSEELSSAQFRYFLRTVPPDHQQARVQADLFEYFKWTYVGTVALLDDSYGRFGVSAIQNESYKRKTFCIAFSEFIPRLRAAQSMAQIVTRIKQQSSVKVVVVWVFGGYAKQFFEEVHRQKLSQRTWILGDVTSAEGSELLGPYVSLLDGALGVQPYSRRDERFEKHLASLTPNKTRFGRNPWWADYWEQFRNCSVQSVDEADPKCFDVPLSRNEAKELFDPYLAYLIDAIYAAAYALDRSIRCLDSVEKLRRGECPPAKSFETGGVDLLSYLKNVSFRGLTGVVEFDDHGDPKESSFEIVNFQVHGAGEKNKFMVGSWNSMDRQRLRLNDSAIKWVNGSAETEVPFSVCSEVCTPGTRQEVTAPCCWKCVQCPGDTVSKEPGSTNCTACPPKQKSNDAKTDCVKLPVKNLRLEDTAGVLLSCVTVVGYCVTTAALVIFLKYRETAIVKASNRQLSFVLLFTIFLSFTLALLSLAEPTDLICRVTQFCRYIIYPTFVSILWLKSARLFVLFQIDAPRMRWQSYISKTKYQVALVALVNSVDVVLLAAWFASDPPFRNEKIQPTQYIFYTCKPYGSSVGRALYFMVCSYVVLLSLLSSFYAFKVRKLPDNFNEARFIAFSLYIILLSAICSYSVEFSVQEGWYVSVIACTTTLVDSFGLLGCMFGPKVFNILFHPERNSQEALRSQITAYVWQNTQLTNLDRSKPTASAGSERNDTELKEL